MTHATSFRSLAKLALLVAVMAFLAAAETASAQHSIEITPTLGYRWGGEISKEDNPALGYDARLRDDPSLGLIINIPITYHVQIELMADHQSTGLRKDTLFSPADDSFEIDVNYYHIGVLGQWPVRNVTPYVVGTVGIADLRPEMSGLSNSRRLSTSLGGGLKLGLSEHVAFRIEARGYWSDTSGSRWDWDEDCQGSSRHCRWDRETDLVQGQIKVGITFRF